jgi:hypothetical protein
LGRREGAREAGLPDVFAQKSTLRCRSDEVRGPLSS